MQVCTPTAIVVFFAIQARSQFLYIYIDDAFFGDVFGLSLCVCPSGLYAAQVDSVERQGGHACMYVLTHLLAHLQQ